MTRSQHGYYMSFMLPESSNANYRPVPVLCSDQPVQARYLGTLHPEREQVYSVWYALTGVTERPETIHFDIVDLSTGETLTRIESIYRPYYWTAR